MIPGSHVYSCSSAGEPGNETRVHELKTTLLLLCQPFGHYVTLMIVVTGFVY